MPAPSRLRRLFAFGKKFKFIMEKAFVSLSQKETESLKMGVGGGKTSSFISGIFSRKINFRRD